MERLTPKQETDLTRLQAIEFLEERRGLHVSKRDLEHFVEIIHQFESHVNHGHISH